MEKPEKVKFQGMVRADLKRALEVEFRESKDPTLQIWNDVVDFCVEAGHEKLAKMNQSPKGMYAAHVYSLKRQKIADEDLKKAEYEVQGYVPRVVEEGNVTPIRKVDEA
jgi:hypothetical protein